jgi:hypothetical protein
VFVTGELLKLVLVERLFSLTRNKLMKISAFAWAYRHYRIAMDRLKTTEAWRTMRFLRSAAFDQQKNWRGEAVRRFALERHER